MSKKTSISKKVDDAYACTWRAAELMDELQVFVDAGTVVKHDEIKLKLTELKKWLRKAYIAVQKLQGNNKK